MSEVTGSVSLHVRIVLTPLRFGLFFIKKPCFPELVAGTHQVIVPHVLPVTGHPHIALT